MAARDRGRGSLCTPGSVSDSLSVNNFLTSCIAQAFLCLGDVEMTPSYAEDDVNGADSWIIGVKVYLRILEVDFVCTYTTNMKGSSNISGFMLIRWTA